MIFLVYQANELLSFSLSDSDLASNLVKTVSDSNQVVPDFLTGMGGSGGGYSGGGTFGAKDIRGGAAASGGDDEDWG